MLKKIASIFIVLLISTFSYAEEDGLLLEKMPDFSKKEESFTETTIKNKLDYPADVIVTFVDRCASNMMTYMPMHPMQSRPLALQMCSCLMDQFRSDFQFNQFKKGGTKLAEMMAHQYGEVCKELKFGKKFKL